MTNQVITATKAKTEFADLVDRARKDPITITRNNRAVAVILSPEEYHRLEQLEDSYWGEKASKVEVNAEYLNDKESLDFLTSD